MYLCVFPQVLSVTVFNTSHTFSHQSTPLMCKVMIESCRQSVPGAYKVVFPTFQFETLKAPVAYLFFVFVYFCDCRDDDC